MLKIKLPEFMKFYRRKTVGSENVTLDYSMSFDVYKYNSMEEREASGPYDVFHGKKNILTPAGRQMIWKALAGLASATDFYSAVNSFIFVGDSSVASPNTSGQPFNLFGVNVVGIACDVGCPTITVGTDGQTVTLKYRATFGVNVANFNWKEAGLCNASAISGAPDLTALPGSGTLLNRYVPASGTIGLKTSGLVWVGEMNLVLGPTGD